MCSSYKGVAITSLGALGAISKELTKNCSGHCRLANGAKHYCDSCWAEFTSLYDAYHTATSKQQELVLRLLFEVTYHGDRITMKHVCGGEWLSWGLRSWGHTVRMKKLWRASKHKLLWLPCCR